MCNSGGLLDLPQAHFNLVRCGILPLGVYPSEVCRRIAGVQPVYEQYGKTIGLDRIKWIQSYK